MVVRMWNRNPPHSRKLVSSNVIPFKQCNTIHVITLRQTLFHRPKSSESTLCEEKGFNMTAVLFAGRDFLLYTLPKHYRRSLHWIVLFSCESTFRWYDWTCMTWILLCLYLATPLLKTRRKKKWRLVLKIKERRWEGCRLDEACWIYEQLRSVSCILRFQYYRWTYF